MKKFIGLFKARKEKESSASSSEEQGLTDYKLLSHSHHVELRKNALTTYLDSLWDTLYGPESMDDPVNVVRTVHAIYATLDDSCVFFNWNQMDWKLSETTDVSYLNLLFVHHVSHFMTHVFVILYYCRQCMSYLHLQFHLSSTQLLPILGPIFY